jgi:hypothetical protein
MVTARRTTLVVLLVGAAFLMAMLMFGASQRGAPDVAKAATAQNNSQGAAARHSAKAVKANARAHKARVHKARASRRGTAKAQRVAAPAADTPGSEAPGSETESSTEPAGEPPDGYEDPAGQDVQHECPPDCGPGEQG